MPLVIRCSRSHVTWFQPMCGTFRWSKPKWRTFPGSRPRHSCPPPSSEWSSSACRPMQIPRNGRPEATYSRSGSVSERSPSFAIVSEAAPTPGRITPFARATSAQSAVIVASTPTCASARSTLRRLPAS